jgi:tetratricopeptide (TPR) repeat protein
MDDSATPELTHSAATFVGRVRELAELRAALDDMVGGNGRLVLLAGEPGIGKTRLADEFARLAVTQGIEVLWGRCWEGGGAPAYWPLCQIIRACVEGRNAAEQEVLLGSATGEIAQLIPEFRPSRPSLEESRRTSDPESARFRLFGSVATFLRNAARIAPLLIVIDDLHEADQPSLQMLRFVARETKAARIMMLGTYRDAEVKQLPELGQLIGHLIREGSTLPLAGLSKTEVRQFVEQSSGQKAKEKLVADLYRATNGNPLFVDGVVRLLIAGGKVDIGSNEFEIPDGVRESIRRRLATLSSETKTLLSIASVIGNEFDVRSLELVSGSHAEQIVERFEDSRRIGIVSSSGSLPRQYRFAHALVREVLYRDLPASRRVELHGQIGAAIEEIHGDDLKPHQAALAYHFSAASIKEKAIRYSIGAGQAASEVFAYHQARSHWEAALELLQGEVGTSAHRARLLLRLASLCWMIDYGAAIRYAKAALSIFESLGREEQAAECHAVLGIFYAVPGQETSDISHAREHFRKAEATLSKGPEGPRLARLYTGISQTAFASRRTSEGLVAGKRAMEIAEEIHDERESWAAAAIQYATHLVVAARLAESRSLLDQAWQIADRLNVGTLASIATWTAGRCWVFLLDSPEALRWYQRELSKPRVENYRPLLLELLGEALARAGDLAGARRLSAGTAQAQILAGLLFYEGRWDEAEAYIKDQAPKLRDCGDTASLAWCLNILANTFRVCGRPDEARAVFEEYFSTAAGESQPGYEFLIRPVSVMTRVEMGQVAAAEHELVRCREIMASGEDWRGLAGVAVLAEALVAVAGGRFQNAEAQFEKAAEIFRRYQVPFEEAEALYYHARALNAAGQHDRANQKLDAAIGIYRRCGAGEQWLKRAEAARGPAQALPRLSSEGTELQALVPSEAEFRRQGDYWTLSYRGKTSRLKDAKGFHYLANLLARPGEEILALDLVVLSGGPSVEAVEIAQAREVTRSQTVARDLGQEGEVLDAQAKAAYKRRLTELRQKLADARELGDEEHADEAEEEIRALGRELKSALGLSGRTRRAASSSERASLAVTEAIRFALGKILKNDAELSKLLAATIKTGTVCSYLPPADFPLRWRI